MRKPSSDLFLLIHSMSADEKRHFRSYARQYQYEKQGNNLKLYNLIAAQEEYDEAAVKAALDTEMTDNQFAVAKNYLYTTLLKALATYLGERGGVQKVRQQVKIMEALFQKELIAQCEKVMAKANAMADGYDHPGLQIELLHWQRRIWSKKFFVGVTEEDVKENERQMMACLARLQRAQGLHSLNTQFMLLVRKKGYLMNAEESKDAYRAILEHPLLQEDALTDSLTARIPYHFTRGMYALMTGQHAVARAHFEPVIHDLEATPDIAYDYFDVFVSMLYNYGIACIHLNNYDKVADVVGKLASFKAMFSPQRARIFYCRFLLQGEWLAATFQFDKLLSEVAVAREKFDLLRKQLNPNEQLSIVFSMAYVYFAHGKYLECHRLLQNDLTPELVAGNTDLHIVVEILRLILYYEMREVELFVQCYRALYRHLFKLKPRYKLEMRVLTTIGKMSKQTDAVAEKEALKALHAELVEIRQNPKESRFLEYFNFETWILSKTEGITVLEAIRKVVQGQS
jgi:hypothetical protein